MPLNDLFDDIDHQMLAIELLAEIGVRLGTQPVIAF
jgi:hypothetical protein